MKRREFVSIATCSTAALLAGCFDLGRATAGASPGNGRLTLHPRAPTKLAGLGLQPLGLSGGRDGNLYVPDGHVASERLPLLVLLHGAGQSSALWFGSYGQRADSNRIVMLAPDSRGPTWDLVMGGFDEDVAFIQTALDSVFDRCGIDPTKVSVAGFSDGATYSLALGLTNGDLFSHVVAYSPGFLRNSSPHGKPPVFISHGTNDTVLPIDKASRKIVPILNADGYATQYMEFTGGHEVPAAVSDAAITWLSQG